MAAKDAAERRQDRDDLQGGKAGHRVSPAATKTRAPTAAITPPNGTPMNDPR